MSEIETVGEAAARMYPGIPFDGALPLPFANACEEELVEAGKLVECPHCGAIGDPAETACYCPPEGYLYEVTQRNES
jgi:hypothetical protein